jgi:thiol-disulfide isomerase/thioredoxin
MASFKTQSALMVGLFIVGLVLVIFWAMKYKKSSTENFENAPAYKMVMYGVDWCPHCVSAKPQFEALGATKTIGGKVVEFLVVNPEKDPEAVKGKNIEGYPTFHLYDGSGKLVKEYDGERTTEGFLQFLNKL